MELVAAISPILVLLVLLAGPSILVALLAVHYGVDSRPGIEDDHRASGRRPTGSI